MFSSSSQLDAFAGQTGTVRVRPVRQTTELGDEHGPEPGVATEGTGAFLPDEPELPLEDAEPGAPALEDLDDVDGPDGDELEGANEPDEPSGAPPAAEPR